MFMDNDFFELLSHKIISKDIYIRNKLKNYPLLEHTINLLALNTEMISVREINKILNDN
jgi:hypothetical protein